MRNLALVTLFFLTSFSLIIPSFARAGGTYLQCQEGQGGGLVEYSFAFNAPYEKQGAIVMNVYKNLDERLVKTEYGDITKSRKTFSGQLSLAKFDVLMVDRFLTTRVIGRIRGQRSGNVWHVRYQPWRYGSDSKGLFYFPDRQLPEKEVYCF